uniref:Endonuclease n=1 Tax=Plectus sambesii TaxID=2011161 RepID=A0A914X115_9BILA
MLSKLGKIGVALTAVGTSFALGANFAEFKDTLLPLRRIEAASMPDGAVPLGSLTLGQPSLISPKSRASEIMQLGFPGFDNLRTFEDFVLSYDRKNRTAHWVVEHLTPDRMVYDKSVDRGKCAFRPDDSVHDYFRSKNEDYKGSGYDRGHLAAAGNHRRTQIAVDQTFLLSNMAPQVGRGFNRDKWNDLEKRVRGLARKHPNVFICTGPLYLPRMEPDGSMYVKYKVIGKTHVSVPTHFFKVMLMEVDGGKYDMEAYVLPNQAIPNETPLASFQVPIASIERAAGFLIFDQLPKNKLRLVNGQKAGSLW